MSKILLATAILAAYEAATTHDQKDAVMAQIIESVKEQEAENAKALETESGYIGDIATYKAARESDATEIANANTNLLEANQTIADLGKQLDLQSKSPGSSVLVSHKKETYKIIGNNFITRKGTLDASALAKDKELIAEMIEKGSGSLELLKD